ncbi:hypothetical protein AB0E61_23365 [Streptomyces catenulae]|uniref:SCO6045-like C-terminal domain-containing protein n=1 Tax=Streptomyces catenulae TaxID=66875 RepID=A0ABV2Z4V7_9ACTN|nr:hypothetical protein [Streptomyces catenulae]
MTRRPDGGPDHGPIRTADTPGARESAHAPRHVPAPDATEAARARLARAQEELLAALVAGAPVPEGFDPVRLEVQRRALVAKRATVIAKIAPELPEILGAGYRPAFLAYARGRPLTGGHRRDALDFAAHLLAQGRPDDAGARARLTRWWQDRAGPRPPRTGPLARLTRSPLLSRLLRAVRSASHRR